MKKNKFIRSLLAIMMVTVLSVGFVSCGDENLDEINPPVEDVIEDDGVPNGTPGNESMFGVYSAFGYNGHNWKILKEEVALYHYEDFSSWEKNGGIYCPTIYVVDEKTIYWVYDEITITQSRPISDENNILVESESYTVNYTKYVAGRPQNNTATYYLVHNIYKMRYQGLWEGRYAMNGSKMIVHTDEKTKKENGREVVAVDYNTYTWDYSDGVIDTGGAKYVKVK